jgi:hypothetical protein
MVSAFASLGTLLLRLPVERPLLALDALKFWS